MVKYCEIVHLVKEVLLIDIIESKVIDKHILIVPLLGIRVESYP
jgi:hypothetical protein